MTTPTNRPSGESATGDEVSATSLRKPELSLSGCELLEAFAAELALGSLTGPERSAALAHLDECQHCRRLVEELTAAAESLLLIAPEADPPAGFEVRLLERLKASRGPGAAVAGAFPAGADGDRAPTGGTGRSDQRTPVVSLSATRDRTRRRFATRARVLLAAAVVAVAAGVGLAFEAASHPAPTVEAIGQIRIASLHASGTGSSSAALAGEVVITAGRPSWLLMTVDLRATGWVTCEVTAKGRHVAVGTFELYHGRGSWATRIGQPGGAITSARILDSSGQLLASASFPT
jgi:hypothetical protein